MLFRSARSRAKMGWVEVKWPGPSALVERFKDLPIDSYITLTEGSGQPSQSNLIPGKDRPAG